MTGIATLQVDGVHVKRGTRPILRGVELSVTPGEIVGLMGTSGAGKTTVLRAVAALEPFQTGAITVDGFTMRAGPLPRASQLAPLRRRVGMVFQTGALFEHLTALENVMLAPVHALHLSPIEARERAMRHLTTLGVAHRVEAYPRQLSGGEAQRVAIARALATSPTMLLMDEPTSALDPARRASLGEALRSLAADGHGLLIATHDVDFAQHYTDRVAVLSEGVIIETGRSGDVLLQPQHEATRALLRAPNG